MAGWLVKLADLFCLEIPECNHSRDHDSNKGDYKYSYKHPQCDSRDPLFSFKLIIR